MAYATSINQIKEPPFIMAPLNYQSGNVESFSAEEIRELNQVVSSLKGTLEIDKEALREIKEDREEYCEVSRHECYLASKYTIYKGM